MISGKPEEIKVGVKFLNLYNRTYTIMAVGDRISVKSDAGHVYNISQTQLFRHGFYIIQEIQPIINPHMSEYTRAMQCTHLNVREERYFCAKVYKTCIDCNKALN